MTCVAVWFGVWCGGGLGKQRMAQPQKRNQWARRELFLLQNRSAPAICVAVVKVWREGSRGCKYELFFLLKSFCFFKLWAWRGKHLLADVKPVFYNIAWMFSLNKIINYCCLIVLLICLSFINYNLLYYYFINYKIINCCLVKYGNII